MTNLFDSLSPGRIRIHPEDLAEVRSQLSGPKDRSILGRAKKDVGPGGLDVRRQSEGRRATALSPGKGPDYLQGSSQQEEGGGSVGKHPLPKLPYAYDALEPLISEETLKFHHDKHHKSYVDGLNDAEKKISKAREDEDFEAIPALNAALEFHAGGDFLHTLYWESLVPPSKYAEPSDTLIEAIEQDFGSWESFRAQMKESMVKVRGSGWGVLVKTPSGLRVLTIMNHENGVLWDGIVLLPIDAWEHAYYIDYRNDRATHFDALFDNLVNWAEIERRLKAAKKSPSSTNVSPSRVASMFARR